MFFYHNKKNLNEKILYSNILNLSRKKIFYTTMFINDSFQNRIILIFLHASFLFIKVKNDNNAVLYKKFSQSMFDYIFRQIEVNMREIGYGDVSVNKNMKFLVKTFYSILLYCENYKQKDLKNKKTFFFENLSQSATNKNSTNSLIIDYFDKYEAFCFDLTSDSVLKGNLKFNFKAN